MSDVERIDTINYSDTQRTTK